MLNQASVRRHKDDPFIALKNLLVNPRTVLQGVALGQNKGERALVN